MDNLTIPKNVQAFASFYGHFLKKECVGASPDSKYHRHRLYALYLISNRCYCNDLVLDIN